MPAGASTRNRTLSVNPAVLTFRGHPAGFVISPGFLFCKEDSRVCPELQPTEKAQEVALMPEAPHKPFCSERRSTRCLCTGPGIPSCHGTSLRAVHTHTVEMKPGEHFQTMLLIKRSSFLRQVFPSSYLNRKYFFILDLPKSPKQMGKSNPQPRGRRGAGWTGLCKVACLWPGCLSFALSGTYCQECKCHVSNGLSL